MTLRMPFAGLAAALLTIVLLGSFFARPASAHELPDAVPAAEVSDVGPAQLEPRPDAGDQSWIWFAVGAFVFFAALGLLFAVFGYLEATRRD